MLVGTSLLSVVLLSLHLAEDAFHAKAGSAAAGTGNLTGILILVLLLAGPALAPERRFGRVIMLVVALAAIGMPALHFSLNGDRSRYSDALLFIWGLIVLGVNGGLSLLLWISELQRRRAESRTSA